MTDIEDSATVKVAFDLPQDSDGYPPASVETCWASVIDEHLRRLANVPFFAMSVSHGDVVEVQRREDGRDYFARVVVPSGNSTVRIVPFGATEMDRIVTAMNILGCWCEVSDPDRLIAVNIPADVAFAPVRTWLMAEAAQGNLDYQESCLAHADA